MHTLRGTEGGGGHELQTTPTTGLGTGATLANRGVPVAARPSVPNVFFGRAKYRVKSTHDAYENTWKCCELKLYFSPSAGG